jgi:hemolysin type calcium-binding protein/WD40 repeat protein
MRKLGVVVVLAVTFGLAGSGGAGIYVPPPPGDTRPAWSPDGSVIVFLSERDGLSLRVMNADGSDEHRLPWLPANATYVFSPDWSHIAALDGGQVVVERLDGSDRVSVGPAAYGTLPSWSPDGTRVAFAAPSAVPNQADVVVARIDGSETRRIAVGYQPVWAPAGERIAYLAGPYENRELRLVNAGGSGDVAIARGGEWEQPVWSPDGTRLAVFHRKPKELGSALEIVGDNGGRLGSFRVKPSEAVWSPRGDAIAYSNGAGLWVLDLESRRSRLVARFGAQPAWAPDGRQLAFASGGECRNRNGIYRAEIGARRLARISNDCRIVGTSGDDVLTGTGLADLVLGEDGNDTLKAVADYWTGDTLEGGPGRDLLLGSYSGDTLQGGSGADILRGGPSADRIVGGAGRDVLQSQGGRDAIYARDGWRDTVSCGTNRGRTTGPEGDIAYVDRADRVSSDCEYVYRPGPAPPVRGRISLEIRVWPQGNNGPKSPRRLYTLRCRPARGTLPNAAAACARLVRVQNPFAPSSPAEPCYPVLAGVATAGIHGIYGGRLVHGGFERLSSCGVRHWNRVAFLFPTR